MKFNDLPKQKRLLIYMFYYEAESSNAITMSKNGNDIIAYGISKNKTSLANMLYNLRKKKLVSESILKDGSFAYPLTISGQNEAKRWIERCDEGECLPGNVEQPNETKEEINVDFVSLANMFADAAKRFTQQPKKNNKLQKENAALVEEIEKLKYDLHCAKAAYDYLEEERDSLKEINERMSLNMDSVNKRLAAKVKECEQLTSDVNNLVSACKTLKNERNCARNECHSLIVSMKKASDEIHSMETKLQALRQENEELKKKNDSIAEKLSLECGKLASKVLSYENEIEEKDNKINNLRHSLNIALSNLNDKTKHVEFLENGLEKIAANCHYMGNWAIMMKEGIGKTA